MWASGGGAEAEIVFKLASVCRTWRTTLLYYGAAWSTVSLGRVDVLQLMLQRSKSAPIYIYINVAGLTSSESDVRIAGVGVALQQARGRTRELRISVRDQLEAHDAMNSLTAETSSGLRVLELIAIATSRAYTVYKLSAGHLGGSMPLRRLTLHSTKLMMGASTLLHEHCRQLVHLELSAVHGLSLPDMLGALSAARNTLLTVSLEIKSFTALSPAPTSLETISLIQLRALSLKGLVPPFTHLTPDTLLSHITYGPTTVLTVYVDYHRDHAIPDALCAHLRQRRVDAKSALLSQSDEQSAHPRLRLRCWASHSMPDFFNLDEHPPAVIDLGVRLMNRSSVSTTAAVSALSSIAAAINMRNVRRMAVAPLFREVPWVRMLGRFPVLSELTLYGPAVMLNLRDAYASVEGKVPSYALRGFTAPGLEHLTTVNVMGLDLARLRPEPLQPPSSLAQRNPRRLQGFGRPPLWVNSQHDALSQLLATLPQPLDELCISYSDACLSDITPLQFLVKGNNVIWDGSVHGCASLPSNLVLDPESP